MCKIFDLCSEIEDVADGVPFSRDCDELFETLKALDFPTEQSMDQPIDQEIEAPECISSGCDDKEFPGLVKIDDPGLDQMCLLESSNGFFELLQENLDPDTTQQRTTEDDSQPRDSVATTAQEATTSPQQPSSAAQPPTKKRRRNKTAEEIREQAEKLRCRRRDAAARSRKRKADYVKQLEQENEQLHIRLAQLEKQLSQPYSMAKGCLEALKQNDDLGSVVATEAFPMTSSRRSLGS